MTDVLTPEQRRLNMSRVRGKDTKPEMLLRRGLDARGLRYRLHSNDLPGKPDLVLPRHRAVILIHGCFWHGHNCPLFKWPATRIEFWRKKIEGNRARDAKSLDELLTSGWRVLVVWECALRGRFRRPLADVCGDFERFVRGSKVFREVCGLDTERAGSLTQYRSISTDRAVERDSLGSWDEEGL